MASRPTAPGRKSGEADVPTGPFSRDSGVRPRPGHRYQRPGRAGTAVPGAGRGGRGTSRGGAACRRRVPGPARAADRPRCAARPAGVSNQAASELLRQLRAGQGVPPGAARAA